MKKRLEWMVSIPEAMTDGQVDLNVLRLKVSMIKMTRNNLECKIRTMEDWIRWYKGTDFRGRYPTNQYIFVSRALPILKTGLAEMGNVRAYTKHKKHDKSKS